MNINQTNFFNCKFDKGSGPRNDDFFKERDFLGGWTVSNRHPVIGLKRYAMTELLPDKSINNATANDLRSIIERTILKYATDKNLIFMSGGKDSTSLAHIFKKLDIPFKAISLYSDFSTTSEVPVVQQIEKALDIEVEYFKIDVIPGSDFEYWVENPYSKWFVIYCIFGRHL